jgi:uncharacterized membrane protein
MEELVKILGAWVTAFLEGTAAVIIGVSAIQSVFIYLKSFRSRQTEESTVKIRLKLGRSLSLALEFLLGADILQTAIAPTWNEIGQLAAIAVLRTALNFFLERELRNEDSRKEPNSSSKNTSEEI